jgi:AcrR family transcriptional regulator
MVRGKPREDAILRACLEVLERRGYEALTMDEVAAEAQASKATIYRRWSNKAELVGAALDALDAADNAAIPDTGRLRSDLLAVLAASRDKASEPYVAMIGELVVASRRDPVLAAVLRKHTAKPELSPFHEVLRRAARRGEIAPRADFDLIHDVAEAMLLREIQMGLPFDDAFMERVVDDVLLRLLEQRKSGKR